MNIALSEVKTDGQGLLSPKMLYLTVCASCCTRHFKAIIGLYVSYLIVHGPVAINTRKTLIENCVGVCSVRGITEAINFIKHRK